MGLINRLLGRERKEHDIPPGVRAVFDKVRHLLSDEDAQNDLYLPEVSAAISGGAAIDRLENAVGDFGRDVRNPIPVNGVLGELIYISHLVTSSGSRLVGHRIGTAAKVDIYEVAALDGTAWDVLFFDLYHPRSPPLLCAGGSDGGLGSVLPIGCLGPRRRQRRSVHQWWDRSVALVVVGCPSNSGLGRDLGLASPRGCAPRYTSTERRS